jgi:hypothetical protein
MAWRIAELSLSIITGHNFATQVPQDLHFIVCHQAAAVFVTLHPIFRNKTKSLSFLELESSQKQICTSQVRNSIPNECQCKLTWTENYGIWHLNWAFMPIEIFFTSSLLKSWTIQAGFHLVYCQPIYNLGGAVIKISSLHMQLGVILNIFQIYFWGWVSQSKTTMNITAYR